MVIQSLWLPFVESVKDKIERKVCAVAMIKILLESRSMELAEIRTQILPKLSNLITGIPTTISINEEVGVPDGENEKDYTSGYTLLSHIMKLPTDPCKEINPAALLHTVTN